MRARALTLVATASLSIVGLGGCAWLAGLVGQPDEAAQAEAEAESKRLAEQAAREQAAADQQLAAELDTLRAAAEAEAATLDQVIAFVEKVSVAMRSGAIDRGAVAPTVVEQAWAVLDQQDAQLAAGDAAETVRDRSTIQILRGILAVEQGDHNKAAAHYLAALELAPSVELFDVLVTLQKTPETDAALQTACPLVRPLVVRAQIPDFIAVCIDASAGDRSKLGWKTAKADLKLHDTEMAHRAEQQRLREEEEARQAEEAAKLAEVEAEEAAQAHLWATGAVFASGRCRFSNCLTDGWEASTDQGTVTSTCRFSNCLKDGWETRFPDGGTATTTCRFSDCMKDGWETRFPDGSTATTSCRFSNCPEDGWETRLPDGQSATTTCRFSDCFKEGWETRMPSATVTCSCKFSDCLKDGTDCR